MHFKQLFLLDGRQKRTSFTPEDEERTKLIAFLLKEWGLVKLKKEILVDQQSDVVVISFAEKTDWNLCTKYNIGKKIRNKTQ